MYLLALLPLLFPAPHILPRSPCSGNTREVTFIFVLFFPPLTYTSLPFECSTGLFLCRKNGRNEQEIAVKACAVPEASCLTGKTGRNHVS
ncbi:hypothetical protein BDV41DRAFT_490694 [Aspergillus transmontanensis]|uniref:Secreted protein n=1 Tax=Aspergillus transmontanensis TaxID=1034304 RepID=A0A5N6WB69_9EURO|nr:hypothetical protein BDV41DRAFT_490694 [Aspergillus transmontanensis]